MIVYPKATTGWNDEYDLTYIEEEYLYFLDKNDVSLEYNITYVDGEDGYYRWGVSPHNVLSYQDKRKIKSELVRIGYDSIPDLRRLEGYTFSQNFKHHIYLQRDSCMMNFTLIAENKPHLFLYINSAIDDVKLRKNNERIHYESL